MVSETLENLKKAILEYDSEDAERWAKQVILEQIAPLEALDVLSMAIRQVGDAFGRGEAFLPELVAAADAMQKAAPTLEVELKKRGGERKALGIVVIGAVYGDIHTIGKSMVSTLLTADGFTVHDIGINVTAEEFIKAVREHKADILALSALLTITAPEQEKVIKALTDTGIRDEVKIMVGGGAITDDFARSIGADGYAPTAPGATKLARILLKIA